MREVVREKMDEEVEEEVEEEVPFLFQYPLPPDIRQVSVYE